MATARNLFNSLQPFDIGGGRKGQFYSLPALEAAGVAAQPPPGARYGVLYWKPGALANWILVTNVAVLMSFRLLLQTRCATWGKVLRPLPLGGA